MLQSMRKQAKGFLAFILFGLLILSFAIWGIGDIFRQPTATTVVVEIGDSEIAADRLVSEVQREMQVLQRRSGVALDSEQALQIGLVSQVIGRMVGTALLDLAARDLGIAISDGLVSQAVQTDANFRNQFDRFDLALYRQRLRALGLNERFYEEIVRGDLARLQLSSALTAVETVPKPLAHGIYNFRRERRVADVLFMPDSHVTDLPAPTDDDLAAYHETNSDRFMAPEYRKITAVIVRPEALMQGIDVSDERLREEYELRIDEFQVTERRTVEQMLFADETAARVAASRLAAGEDFAAVARETTGQAPLALGTVTRDDLPLPELAEAAFALAVGTVSAPVESALGWHLLRVTAVEAGTTKSLDEVRDQLRTELRREDAIEMAIDLGEKLDTEIGGGASIEEVATRLSLEVVRIEAVDARGRDRAGSPVDAVPAESDFLERAFQLPEGENSLLGEAGDGSYFVLRVDAVTASALRPLAEIRDQVAAQWSAQKRADALRERAEALAERARTGTPLAELAAAEGLTPRTTAAFDREGRDAGVNVDQDLVERLFAVGRGEVAAGPVAGGYSVAVVKEIRKANPLADADGVERLSAGLRQAMVGDLLAQFSDALRARYPVEIDERAVQNLFLR